MMSTVQLHQLVFLLADEHLEPCAHAMNLKLGRDPRADLLLECRRSASARAVFMSFFKNRVATPEPVSRTCPDAPKKRRLTTGRSAHRSAKRCLDF